MAIQAVHGAVLRCSMGLAPGGLQVPPVRRASAGGSPAATILDNAPLANIMPFGMCTSPANPAVAAATAAALGVLTPMPCIPATSAPWVPGSPTVLIGNQPALNNTSQCMCMWAGVISVVFPGQVQTQVP